MRKYYFTFYLAHKDLLYIQVNVSTVADNNILYVVSFVLSLVSPMCKIVQFDEQKINQHISHYFHEFHTS